MKNGLHGILYTLRAEPDLGELVRNRSSASIPFCARYRLIDFALSSMVNAGVRDVGVIMERDYQSLLDHLSGGKDWGLSRRHGGLRLLPPFGLPQAHSGRFSGCMEALRSVRSYIEDISCEDIFLAPGDVVANIDLAAVWEQHRRSGAAITAICAPGAPDYAHHRYIPGADGFAQKLLFAPAGAGEGLACSEMYILKRSLLLSFMDDCADGERTHFHRDAVAHYLASGGAVGIYVHEGYIRRITSARDYFSVSMDMLDGETMADLFPESRPIRTKERAEVSTYYGDGARVKNSLLADGCYIEGELENCIVFRNVRVEKGAKLENCILMQDTVIRAGASLRCVIADKDVTVSQNCFLAGVPGLPILVPKGASI